MTHKLISAAALALFAATPLAAQDAAVGETEFGKCKACHKIEDADGNAIVRGGPVGPNLWNVIGRSIAGAEGFRYGDGLMAVAEANPDMVWTEENLAAFITDPTAWVREQAGDDSVKSKMTFKMRDKQADVAAYLASVSPDKPE